MSTKEGTLMVERPGAIPEDGDMDVPIGSEARQIDREQLAFTSDQAIKLADITKRKLDYWIAKGLITPDISRGEGRGRVRLFSFGNLVELRVVSWLRGAVSLQAIRALVQRLRLDGLDRPLGDVGYGIYRSGSGFRVVLRRPDGAWEDSKARQLLLEGVLPIESFVRSLEDGIRRTEARESKVGRTERRRGTLGSRRVLAGTRVPTSAVWNLHRAGRSEEDIVRSYPGLTVEDVRAALTAEEKDRRTA